MKLWELLENVWSLVKPCEAARNCMKLYESVRSLVKSWEAARNCMKLYQAVWSWEKLYEALWSFLDARHQSSFHYSISSFGQLDAELGCSCAASRFLLLFILIIISIITITLIIIIIVFFIITIKTFYFLFFSYNSLYPLFEKSRFIKYLAIYSRKEIFHTDGRIYSNRMQTATLFCNQKYSTQSLH